jgi:hypothetical protein
VRLGWGSFDAAPRAAGAAWNAASIALFAATMAGAALAARFTSDAAGAAERS